MKRRLVQTALAAAVATGLGWWLFADTFRYFRSAAPDAREIRFSFWGGFEDYRMWEQMVARFERVHPGVRVRAELLPLSGYATKILQQIAAGAAPDVMLFQDEPFPRVAERAFADLDEFIAKDPRAAAALADCWPTGVASFRVGGKQRGIPLLGGNVLIYCNEPAFARASRFHGRPIEPPKGDWTLADWARLSKDLTFDENGDGRIDQYGFLQPAWLYYLPFIWAHGGDLLDDSRRAWRFEGPAVVSALETYRKLRGEWGVSPAPFDIAGQNADTAFLSGRVAMCVNGPWLRPFLAETALSHRYRVVPIPRGPGGNATRVTWDGLCVSAVGSAARRRLAWEFVASCLEPESQAIVTAFRRAIPSRRTDVAGSQATPNGPGDAVDVAFRAAMEAGRVQPITAHWDEMDRAIKRAFADLTAEGPRQRSVEQILKDLREAPEIARNFKVGP